MRIAIVVQARTGSSRLPGKVLLPLAGRPMLVRQLERIEAAWVDAELVVATTTEPADDAIVSICQSAGVVCHRGHPTDLLARHLGAARMVGADAAVKIPSDCPLIDPRAIERVIGAFRAAGGAGAVDYASNLHPATWPDGNDVEVVPIDVLELAAREAIRPHEREHTTPFIWDHPERFRLLNVPWETGRDLSMTHRFTVDWPADYEMCARVYDALWSPHRPVFTLGEILALLERHPEIPAINARYAGVSWYRHHLGELRTVGAGQTRALMGGIRGEELPPLRGPRPREAGKRSGSTHRDRRER
jgi:spore coat polysaccharide biosynthesis protein SpsF